MLSSSKRVSLLHLEFGDPLLELQYEKHTARVDSWACDVVVASFWLFLSPRLVWATEPSRAYYLAAALLFLLAYLFKWALGWERFANLRTAWTVALRVIHHVMIARGQECGGVQAPLEAGWHSWKFLIAKDFASILMTTFGLRLKFSHHVLVHAPLMVFLPITNSYTFCPCTARLEDSSSMFTLEKLLDDLSNTIKTVLHAPFVLFYGDRVSYIPCMQLTRFISVFFGIFVSSYMLWNLEKRSRMKFVQQKLTKNTVANAGLSLSNLIIELARHIVLMTLMYTICWEYLLWVPSIVQKWRYLL